MRILAIRGENLASLAEKFELDFEREPLRSAGLFAITGETGSGKSTILDALCLALYDKFPRVVGVGGNEDAPDPGGEPLNASDPRAILRRGAGSGFAEADFVARDGQRYRARCEIKRARKRASGALQNRARILWRIDEAGEAVETLEARIETVNKKIVELTDLTFEQFRRTALLAQGDFDAFLRAEAKERAELLEKITGAEIYGRLSKRAYEQDRDAQRAVEAQEKRLCDIGVMADDIRAGKLAELAETQAQRAVMAEARRQTQEALRKCDALAQAQGKLAQAQEAATVAADAALALAPERALLAELAQAEPLRAPRDEAARCALALREAQEAAAQAQVQAEASRNDHASALAHEREHAEDVGLLAKQAQELAPLWSRATALDARLAAMSQQHENAQAQAEIALRVADEKRAALALAHREAEMRGTQLADARAAFDRLRPAQALSERWSDVEDWLVKRDALLKEKREAARLLLAAQTEIDRAEKERDAFDRADKQDAETRRRLLEQIAARDEAYAALDEASAQENADEIARALEWRQALLALAQAFDVAQKHASDYEEKLARLSEEHEAVDARVAALQDRHDAQAAADEDAARLGELADAAADPLVPKLRAALVEGVACPVCGGREHPFAHAQDAAHELAALLRKRRDESRRALAKTQRDLVVAQGEAAKLRAQRDDAARRLAEAKTDSQRSAQAYLTRRAEAPEAPRDIEDAAPMLTAQCDTLAATRAAFTERVVRARKLREELDRLRSDHEKTRDAIDVRRRERDGLTAALQVAGEARARTQESIAGLTQRLDSLDRSLAPFLSLCDVGVADLDRDAAGVRRRLESAGAAYGAAQARVMQSDAALRALDIEKATRVAEQAAAEKDAADAQAELAARARDLDELRAARVQLLGGEATDAHRDAFEARRRNATAAHEDARAALERAATAAAAREQSRAHTLTDLVEAEDRDGAAQEAFRAALALSPFDAARAETLLALGAEETQAMRRAVDDADAARRDAETAVAARRADVREAESAAPTDVTRDELSARDAALAQEIDSLAARGGALQEQLDDDDRKRASAQTLAAEIDSARANRKIWAEVSEAIGSADGSKFRRFAQAVTLNELVALANRRLALFAPRYALERGGAPGALSLQIVDHDLGDERRSTRSLSGGERFLASLALALALAGLEGRDSFVDTLFIDEGFGALDAGTLDIAIDALETLQAQGRRVGVISHVESMQQRIATKICVERRGGGVSVVRLRAPGY